MNSFKSAIETRNSIDEKLSAVSKVLNKYPRNAYGLTPDEIKFSKDYQRHKREYDKLFQSLRSINQWLYKNYPKEIRDYSRRKRAEGNAR